MASDLFRDLLTVNRRIFDDAVASVQAEANRDIDSALRDASLWAYGEAGRRPKSELQQINDEAQKRAERRIADIRTTAAFKIDGLTMRLCDQEKAIRAFCERREKPNLGSQRPVSSPDQTLSCIHAPVPPNLAETFGYSGRSRFVAFYHEPTVDDLMVDDGHRAATGEWYAFERWRGHPAVAGYLQDVNLGHADLDATHWLIIDRERGVLYVAHVSTAQAFLQMQHPRPPELQTSEMAELHRRLQGQQRAVAEMLAFLDQAAQANHSSPPDIA
jgi:hypothetical protein